MEEQPSSGEPQEPIDNLKKMLSESDALEGADVNSPEDEPKGQKFGEEGQGAPEEPVDEPPPDSAPEGGSSKSSGFESEAMQNLQGMIDEFKEKRQG